LSACVVNRGRVPGFLRNAPQRYYVDALYFNLEDLKEFLKFSHFPIERSVHRPSTSITANEEDWDH
jgi:hypothetical protein